jgi:cell division transport system permease protein
MSPFMTKFKFVLSEVWQGISRSITLTIALIATFAISLSLLGVSLLVGSQVNEMKDYWFDRVEISIFLCTTGSDTPSCAAGPATEEIKTQVRTDLEALQPLVSEIFFESQQEAYTRFIERFKSSPISANVTPDQLPESFRIKLSNPEEFITVVNKFVDRPGIEAVRDQRATLSKLFSVLGGLQALAFGFAMAMLVVTALLVGNTIRVTAYARRREIGIMRLVGATKMSLRLPFLLEAIFGALLGGLFATAILSFIKGYLVDSVIATSFTFTSFFGWGAVISASLICIASGIVLALATAWFGIAKHLKV